MVFEMSADASETDTAIAPPNPTDPAIEAERTVASISDVSFAFIVTRPVVAVKLDPSALVDTA